MGKYLVILGGLLLFCAAGRADTVYTYTSPVYDECNGSYCSGGPYALTFTFGVVAGTPLDNLSLYLPGSYGDPDSNVTADVDFFTFTDGSGVAITRANASAYSFTLQTDADGNMTGWSVWATVNPTAQTPLIEAMGSNSYFTATYIDYSMVGPPPDDATKNLGYWVPVPEPSSVVLLCLGLLLLGGAGENLGGVRAKGASPVRT